MSMLLSIAVVSPAQIEAIRHDPACVADLLDPEPSNPPKASGSGFLSRLFLGRRSPTSQTTPPRPRVLASIPQHDIYDAAQYWHILHFLFTGSAWEGNQPEAFLVTGGTAVGRDLGYGSPRLFTPEELQAIASFLESLTFEQFSSGYNPAKIQASEIYWQPGSTPTEIAADLETLWMVVGEIRDLMFNAARLGNGILVEIY